MDKEEAKLVLADKTFDNLEGSSFKEDPKIQEVLRLLEADAELSDWWSENIETDRAFQKKIEDFAPPADLKASLYASLEQQQKGITTRRRIIQWLSIAASLVLVGMIGSHFIIDRTNEFEGPLDKIALEYSMYGPRLSFFNKDSAKLVEWLTEQNIDLPAELPKNLLDQKGIGCRPLDWSENRVAIMCFNAETVYHLFIAQDKDFEDFKNDPNIGYESPNKKWTVSSWKSGEHVFVLAAKATIPRMEEMLAGYNP